MLVGKITDAERRLATAEYLAKARPGVEVLPLCTCRFSSRPHDARHYAFWWNRQEQREEVDPDVDERFARVMWAVDAALAKERSGGGALGA